MKCHVGRCLNGATRKCDGCKNSYCEAKHGPGGKDCETNVCSNWYCHSCRTACLRFGYCGTCVTGKKAAPAPEAAAAALCTDDEEKKAAAPTGVCCRPDICNGVEEDLKSMYQCVKCRDIYCEYCREMTESSECYPGCGGYVCENCVETWKPSDCPNCDDADKKKREKKPAASKKRTAAAAAEGVPAAKKAKPAAAPAFKAAGAVFPCHACGKKMDIIPDMECLHCEQRFCDPCGESSMPNVCKTCVGKIRANASHCGKCKVSLELNLAWTCPHCQKRFCRGCKRNADNDPLCDTCLDTRGKSISKALREAADKFDNADGGPTVEVADDGRRFYALRSFPGDQYRISFVSFDNAEHLESVRDMFANRNTAADPAKASFGPDALTFEDVQHTLRCSPGMGIDVRWNALRYSCVKIQQARPADLIDHKIFQFFHADGPCTCAA